MNGGEGITETSELKSSGHAYADTKMEAEVVIRESNEKRLPAIIVQPTHVYGPGDPNWTMRPIELICSGRMALIGRGLQRIQPIFISDLVEGILLAGTVGKIQNSYILCGPNVVTMKDFMGFLLRMHGKGKVPSIPSSLALFAAGLFESVAKMGLSKVPIFTRREVKAALAETVCSRYKAESELGFKARTSLEEAPMATYDPATCGHLKSGQST